MAKVLSKPWTIYPARPLSKVPPEVEAWLGPAFDSLKAGLREEGYKLYDFLGFNPTEPDLVVVTDITKVECADMVVAIHGCPSDGVGGEVAWKCAKGGHVLSAGRKGDYVSSMSRGWRALNEHHRFVEFVNILELIPIINEIFEARTDNPFEPVAMFQRNPKTGFLQSIPVPIAT